MTALDVALLSLACTLLGVGISKVWIMATQFTTIQASIAKAKLDNNAIGNIVKQHDRKANRRNQQMVAAMLEIHAKDEAAIERISALLKDDSWDG